MKIVSCVKLIIARVGAALLRVLCDATVQIAHIKTMYSGFESESKRQSQEKVVSLAIQRFLEFPDVACNSVKFIAVVNNMSLGGRRRSRVCRNAQGFIFIRYIANMTDDVDIMTAVLLDHSVRFTERLQGEDAQSSKQHGLARADQYLLSVDSTGGKAKRYRSLWN